QAAELLGQLEDLEKQGTPAWPSGRAMIYVALGDKDRAMQWLARGVNEDDSALTNNIKVLPMLDPLHGDARFEQLLTELVPPPRAKSDSQAVGSSSLERESSDASRKGQDMTYGTNLLANGDAEEGS